MFVYKFAFRGKEKKKTISRISNGPMESFNNIPKDLKRQSNGVRNFPYTRNRILFSCRSETPILLIPRPDNEIKINGKKRGKYKEK